MDEIEVKILEIDIQKVVETLVNLKALSVFDGDLLTLFLDFQDHQIQKRGDVLRLRREPDSIALTYKKVKINKIAKVANEYTVQVDDFEKTLILLENLGLSVTQRMQKHRTSYKLDNVRFDIDRYSGDYEFIPEFLEIEGTIDEIKMYAKTLGFQEKDCLPWSTDELVNHYLVKKKKS